VEASTAAEQLLEIEAIKKLKARYFRLVDTKQWDEWRRLFAEDAVFHGAVEGARGGPDPFVDYTRSHLEQAVTVHHGHMPEIELTSADTARGVWAMVDYVEFPSDGTTDALLQRGYGHYEEEYRKIAGEWKISSWRLTRIRVDRVDGITRLR
jgi:hypothetical protein